ncbi:MAG: hypothetical protein NTU85_03415 [Candidatus Kaiserbacteria bacterium]|nr:hypothetical protein [Candidatus Kaiserbacteria bacterium]
MSIEKFIEDVFKSWDQEPAAAKTEELKAIVISPKSQDYKALSESTKTSEFGEYTLNPKALGLDLESLQIFIPDLSQFNGKPLYEVMIYVMDIYSGKYHLPGIEYWKWLHENPGKSPAHLKDGKSYFFPGSILCRPKDRWGVPYSFWRIGRFVRIARQLRLNWDQDCRVVLLEKL